MAVSWKTHPLWRNSNLRETALTIRLLSIADYNRLLQKVGKVMGLRQPAMSSSRFYRKDNEESNNLYIADVLIDLSCK